MSTINDTQKIFDLTKSTSFCLMGFVHAHTWPNGRVLPCCAGAYDVPKQMQLGNINEADNWNDIWNGENYKQLRIGMLTDVRSKHCDYCYETERLKGSSTRINFNSTYQHLYDKIMPLVNRETGEVSQAGLYHLDFRFSNLCNQACVTCGPDLSSMWRNIPHPSVDASRPTSKVIRVNNVGTRGAQIYKEALTASEPLVNSIYFAGGEPLILTEHWELLDRFIEIGRAKDIHLTYNTNMTVIEYAGHNALEYWDKFASVTVMASIDEVHDRFHYVRWPGNWDVVKKNIKTLVDYWNETNTGHNKVVFAPTVSLLNAHRLKDILIEWCDAGLIQNSCYSSAMFDHAFFGNILRGPSYYYLGNAPTFWVEHLKETFTDLQDWYAKNISEKKIDHTQTLDSLSHLNQGILGMKNTFTTQRSRLSRSEWEVWMRINAVGDLHRKTMLSEIMPELSWMLTERFYND